jgi:site-specific recombinase XerD
MTVDEIYKLCNKGVRIPPINKIRAVEYIGGKCEKSYFKLQEYENFRNTMTKNYNTTENTTRSYCNYFEPLCNAFGKQLEISDEETKTKFQKWVNTMTKKTGRDKLFCGILESLNAHDDYIQIVKLYFKLENVKVVWDLVKNECTLQKKATGRGTKYIEKYTGTHMSVSTVRVYVNQLKSIHIDNDYTTLSYETALRFCQSQNDTGILGSKMVMLKVLGFPHINQLVQEQKRVTDNVERFREIYRHMKPVNVFQPVVFEDVEYCLKVKIDKIHELAMEEIIDRIRDTNYPRYSYNIICYELKLHNICTDILHRELGFNFTNKKKSDSFKTTEWRTSLIHNIMKKHRERIQNTSAYPQSLACKLEYQSTILLEFIENHTLDHFHDNIVDNTDPIKWFLYTCTTGMVHDLIMAYGRMQVAQNFRVKSAHHVHHAKKSISNMISFFKHSIDNIIPCGSEVFKFTPQYFTSRITDQRIPFDTNKRRVYKDEEIESMLTYTNEEPVYNLIITILREIGLRAGAIMHMKYYSLFDKHDVPRHTCIVVEKGNIRREFVSGPNLKRKLVTYARAISQGMSDVKKTDFYMFNINNPYTPLGHSTFSANLKRIAKAAGIVDVNVHAHAFRHTIVGKLIDEGNSIELVSKFIGHTNTDTTSKHYWLTNIESLSKDMRNPFLSSYLDKQEEREDYVEELELSNKKVDTCLYIIHSYNKIISDYICEHPDVKDLQSKIFHEIPKLQDLLKNIAASVSGTTNTTNSVSSSYREYV